MKRVELKVVAVFFLTLCCSVKAEDEFPFVVKMDEAERTAVDFSYLSPEPAGKHGFVRVEHGHFATDAGPLRIWGVNLVFGANFPTHADAERIAARLARLGINGVRFHHFETQWAPAGLIRKDGSLDPERLDRMDYFIAQLNKHGIYANINLHVGYTPSKRLHLPQLGTKHDVRSDKFVMHFQPEIQQAIFQFWRELLTHKNPYRGLRLVDDPGIAVFEISNESRFVEVGPYLFYKAPEPYKTTILKLWNQWLKKHYGNTTKLKAAWAKGRYRLPSGQTLEAGNVQLPPYKRRPRTRAQQDVLEFMRDVEKDFYRKARKYLTEELGVRVPVTTTQSNYQEPAILAEFADFADLHAYWHHPIFHQGAWRATGWTVQNEPLVEFPFWDKWPRCNPLRRTVWRIHGMPFTFSEWNAADPNFFSAGGISLPPLLACLQDWDGIYFFNYHGRGDHWDVDHIQGWFEINGQPCKTVLLAAFAPLFRRLDLKPLKRKAAAAYQKHETLGALAFQYRVGIDPHLSPARSFPAPTEEELKNPKRKYLKTPDGRVTWDAREQDRAFISLNAPATRAVWGRVAGRSFKLGDWKLTFGKPQQDYAIVVATSRDGRPLETSQSVLIAAVGHAENQNMGWNADRTSVGKKWGKGPSIVNGIPLTVVLPPSQKARTLFALDGSGHRTATIPLVRLPDGSWKANLGPQWKTLWYELALQE